MTNIEPNLIAAKPDGGRIAENIVLFGRLLRAAGLPVGPDRIVLATQAAMSAGIERIGVFRAALEASLVSRPEHRLVFDQAYRIYWKDHAGRDGDHPPSPGIEDHATRDENQIVRRLLENLAGQQQADREPDVELEFDASETFSREELLRTKDFEQMSGEELYEARRAIARIAILNELLTTRRYSPAAHGQRLDVRSMLRVMAAKGTDHIKLQFRDRRKRGAPLVVLIDISGSMDTYARMLLHFVFALINGRGRTHAFLFGTRLTNVTRQLRGRDPDIAIDKVSRDVKDWSGGTRIGEALAEFNRVWGRRVLAQNATVLLITDGLDREGATGMPLAVRRLRASCRRLIWLNPLMRYDGYEPLASGARVLVEHVSEFASCHNLRSLDELSVTLNQAQPSGPHKFLKSAVP